MLDYRLLVVGSRGFNDDVYLKAKLEEVLKDVPLSYNIVIVSGGARGADSLAASYANSNGYNLKEFLPDYATHGKAATHIRNSEMINYVSGNKDADANIMGGIVVFWDGVSKGSYSMIKKAQKAGLPGAVFNYNE